MYTSVGGFFFCAVPAAEPADAELMRRLFYRSRVSGRGRYVLCGASCLSRGSKYTALGAANYSGGAEIMRVKITLACSECKQRNYDTTKNKKNDPDRLEMNKYCKFCRKHTLHKETK